MSNNDSFANTHSAGHVIGGGRYSLHVTLGESSLVWLAQDEVEQRLAVVRFCPPEIRQDARAMDAVRARIRKASNVKHANLARMMEWYEAEGVEPFVAWEYIEGNSAREHVTAGGQGVTWEALQPVAAQVGAALAALHAGGVVHHGVSPENVIVSSEGTRLLSPVIMGVLHNPLFVPSVLKKPLALRCCSPQQLAGAEPTAADDFYGFGATLFEIITGAPLFADSKALLNDIRTGVNAAVEQKLRAAARNIPGPVVDFIMACLQKEPGKRPVSFEVLGPAVAAPEPVRAPVVEDTPAKVVPLVIDAAEVLAPAPTAVLKQTRAAARRRSPMPWLAAACIAACACIGAGAWYVSQNHAEKQRLADAKAAAQQESDRLRQMAEEKQRQAELLEKTKNQEAEARRRAEAELKKKEEEAARLAAADAERKRISSQLTSAPAVQTVKDVTTKTAAPLALSGTDEGYINLFNGRDLSDWQGSTNYWSVVDGYITAQCPHNTPAHKRFYLVSNKGNVEDFELQFAYRFRLLRGNKNPNGGLVYRATTNGTPEYWSYQYDISPDAKINGSINEDKKRYKLAAMGESRVALSTDKTSFVQQVVETNRFNTTRPEDWNQCAIVVKGNHITHYLNGLMVADVVDENTKYLHKSGLVALELHTKDTNSTATFLQFRDIKLKRLPKDSRLASTGN